MKAFVRSLLPAAMIGCLCCGAAMAEDISVVGQWKGKYPIEKIVNDKPLWDQPGILAAIAPLWANASSHSLKKQRIVRKRRWQATAKEVSPHGRAMTRMTAPGNNMTVFFDTARALS